MNFKEKFIGFYKSRGTTAAEVGRKIGYGRKMMSKYTNAEKPNIEFIDRLVKLYPDIDLNFYLKDDDAGTTNSQDKALRLLEDIEAKSKEMRSILSQK